MVSGHQHCIHYYAAHYTSTTTPVRLEAELVVACDLTQISLQFLQQLLVAHSLPVGDEWVQGVELWHGHWSQL